MARTRRVCDASELPEERRGEAEAIIAVHGRIPGPLGVLLHSPGLAPRVMEAGTHLRSFCTLKAPHRELAILTLARERECAYVWRAHLLEARRVGLDESWVDAVERGGDARTDGLEGELISFVRQLAGTHRVEPSLFDRLYGRQGARWTIELTAIVGHYEYMCAILNAFEVLC